MKIANVFTPRSSTVNLKIYIPRLTLEEALLRSINGSMHTLIFGESGNGKSWLYKKVLEQNKIHHRIANCANASRHGSLTGEIISALMPNGITQKIGYTENKEASIKAVFAEGKLNHQGQYKITPQEPLEYAFSIASKEVNGEQLVIVLDNLELIFDNHLLMSELADLIILLDDSRYATYNIKFLIVGVPNGVLEYFAKTKNLESVANRIEELPKVGGLNQPMVNTLVDIGFNKLLNLNITPANIAIISNHIHHITMGVAQCVQEYCEKLAYKIADNRNVFDEKLLQEADKQWLLMGLRQGYTVVESHLNSKKTKISRKNQVLYCIGQFKKHQIDSGVINELIREHFPDTISEANMGIGNILTELSSGDTPLLKKNPKTNEYRVTSPRYIMCIRAMLKIDPESKEVCKLSFAT